MTEQKSISFRFVGSSGFPALPQLDWALGELGIRLADRHIDVREAAPTPVSGGLCLAIVLGRHEEAVTAAARCGVTLPEAAESFAVFRSADAAEGCIYVYGADTRGLVYALTELADRARYMPDALDAFAFAAPLIETPSTQVRSISKCFQSVVEDLGWFRDRQGWEDYLTMLVTHRFNRITLTFGMQYNYPYGNEFLSDVYLYLAYPFLIEVPGHDVAVSNLDASERRRNLEALQFIGREAARRGLEFQVALWTQSYDFGDCPDVNHQITGLGPDNIAPYCRDAIALLLDQVPEISGLTLRVHVECGIPEGAYDFWRTYFEAVTNADRPVRLDLHAKGIDETMIGIALATGMPVTISPKYTSEHMGLPYHQASIRPLERVTGDHSTLYSGRDADRYGKQWKFSEGSRKFMRYSYGDILRDDRPYGVVFRIWPGTQRVLLSGDPILAGGYGQNASFGGAQGIELCEPLSFKGRMGTGLAGSRTGYRDGIGPERDWEKFAYTYRVWGRSLYDPKADLGAFRRVLEAKFGAAGEHCFHALGAASRILPLITHAHTATASNNSYWPEMYENMSVLYAAPALPYGYEQAQPARFGTVGSTDPQLFMAPSEFAACLHDGEPVRRISPLTWANWLDLLSKTAADKAACIADILGELEGEAGLLAIDVVIQAGVGRFFAEKVRAAVFWEYHRLSGSVVAAERALQAYRRARQGWSQAASASARVYVPDISYGPHSWLRGRWDDRLPAIDRDIADMEKLVGHLQSAASTDPDKALRDVDLILNWSTGQSRSCLHTAPSGFVHGEPIELSCGPLGDTTAGVTLHYRHANQAEDWRSAAMIPEGGAFRAHIPGDYTASPYSILYYFELTDGKVSSFFPGLHEDISNVPYFYLGCV